MSAAAFAVLLQGPFFGDYTVATFAQLRKVYPSSILVLSTWVGEVPPGSQQAGKLDSLGVYVVSSERPCVAGTQNTNLQLASTRAGLDFLAASNVDVVFKSRTDCRVEADMLALYDEVQARYPVREGTTQSARIILARSYTRRGLPYHAADMVMVGPLKSLRIYFDAPHRSETETHAAIFQGWRAFSFYDRLFSAKGAAAHVEQYLCIHYLERIGWQIRYTVADWHEVLARLFYVADDRQIGFRWKRNPGRWGADGRYDSDYIVNRSLQIHSSLLCRRVRNSDWLEIYAGKRPRLDAGSPTWLLWTANALRFLADLPRWTLGWLRRLRIGR